MRVQFRILFFIFLFSGGAISKGLSQKGFPYCESFQGDQLKRYTRLGGQAGLADGALRLTENGEDQSGYVYVDLPFPSYYGINITFEYFCYGGTGADGLAFFLFDAAVAGFSPGGFGGALGYAQRNETHGLRGAYLGLGLDSFGNFGNTGDGKIGGFPEDPAGLHPNSIVLRGPGNSLEGYSYVSGRLVNQGGGSGLPESAQFSVCGNNGRVTDESQVGYRKVFIELLPNPGGVGFLVNMEMQVTTQAGNPRMVSIFEDVLFEFIPPENLKVGFSASTGALTNYHEIRNLEVSVSDQQGLQSPEGEDLELPPACVGIENPYFFGPDNFNFPNENSQLQCIRFFASQDEIEELEEDMCISGHCESFPTELELEVGILMVSESGFDFTFSPIEGNEGETVRVYYTLTDNYGKVSEGNWVEIPIREDPGEVIITVEGIPLEEWYLCQGEDVILEAQGEEEFVAYEWFRDGNPIVNAEEKVLIVSHEGVFSATAYNDRGCMVSSNEFTVLVPELPELGIVTPVRGCNPEAPIYLSEEIDPYFPEDFDYRVRKPDGSFLINEAMDTVYTSGSYELSVKPKAVDCWSEPLEFDISVSDVPIEAAFDYGIDGTERKTDDEGRVFIEDPIWFTDESTGNPVSWEWDFGNGQTSGARNPVHVFGETGTYLVTLKVRNDNDCEASYSMEIEIDRSYRIMFPTGFTPDSEENTHFRPKTKGVVNMEFMVFNRWGEMIFRSEDANTDGWDGNLNGVALPPGRYVYRVNLESVEGEKVSRSGSVLLVR
ncbi:PKD domain-containing protein [Pleomorphovibrio marinus]|uniref:PKD domain-containing protein n=1 Tax=Pleomorphovibrio marinus TaxID=2164132 RepID=UPI000E0B5FBB|nr:PKD domain-containing protein [Pleomorphovibrio marinus]